MCNIRHVWSVPTHVPEYQKKGSAPISRVLFRKASHAALCHLSNLQVTLQLKRSTLHRLCRVGRAPSNDGLHELAASSRHSPNDHPSAGGLLHHLLTLTGTKPAVVLFCLSLLSPIASIFGSGVPYAARTFLSPHNMGPAAGPGICFPGAKIAQNMRYRKQKRFFLLF